jgi:uncharacterized protein (DUF1330 family)
MIKPKNTLLALLLLQLAFAFPAIADSHEAKGYLLAQIEVTDRQAYMDEYGSRAIPTIMNAGGKVLVANWDAVTSEGSWPSNLTVVVEFPSLKAAQSWYASEEYSKAKPFRLKNAEYSNLILLEGVPPQM